jgi:hypothetical protein
MTNAEVMQKVVAGYRLASPEGCPQEVVELMERCWHHRPEARPRFKEIYEKIESIWNDFRQGNVEITVDNQNLQIVYANYLNQDIQQPSNYNNESVNVHQPSNANNSNYNNQPISQQ